MNSEVVPDVVDADAKPDGGNLPEGNAAAAAGAVSAAPAGTDQRNQSKPLPEDALIILPVRNLVLFPGVILPITVGRTKSRAAAQEAARLQRPLGVLLQTKPEIDDPRAEDLH